MHILGICTDTEEDINMRYNDELYHFGIKGMKWGVRRFQNSDGSLTSAGARRYGGSAGGGSRRSSGGRGGSGSRRRGLSARQKRALKVAGALAGTAALAYGAHRFSKTKYGQALGGAVSSAARTYGNRLAGSRFGKAAGAAGSRIANSKFGKRVKSAASTAGLYGNRVYEIGKSYGRRARNAASSAYDSAKSTFRTANAVAKGSRAGQAVAGFGRKARSAAGTAGLYGKRVYETGKSYARYGARKAGNAIANAYGKTKIASINRGIANRKINYGMNDEKGRQFNALRDAKGSRAARRWAIQQYDKARRQEAINNARTKINDVRSKVGERYRQARANAFVNSVTRDKNRRVAVDNLVSRAKTAAGNAAKYRSQASEMMGALRNRASNNAAKYRSQASEMMGALRNRPVASQPARMIPNTNDRASRRMHERADAYNRRAAANRAAAGEYTTVSKSRPANKMSAGEFDKWMSDDRTTLNLDSGQFEKRKKRK